MNVYFQLFKEYLIQGITTYKYDIYEISIIENSFFVRLIHNQTGVKFDKDIPGFDVDGYKTKGDRWVFKVMPLIKNKYYILDYNKLTEDEAMFLSNKSN